MMAKLYWRVKKNGKWTWRAATAEQLRECKCKIPCIVYCLNQDFEEVEEE